MSEIANGNGWTARFRFEAGPGIPEKYVWDSLPIAVWGEGDDGRPVGYVAELAPGNSDRPCKLRSAESYNNFVGYEPAERARDLEAQDLRDSVGEYGDRWLEVELRTGRRFTGRRHPDGDNLTFISFLLQGQELTFVDVLPSAIISVTVDYSAGKPQGGDR
jgi:hypothetical protein